MLNAEHFLNQCHIGDCRETMRGMVDAGVKVQCIVTSPPYWGLRSYLPEEHPNKHQEIGLEAVHDCGAWTRSGMRQIEIPGVTLGKGPELERVWIQDPSAGIQLCGHCHICNLLEVFNLAHALLADDGVMWLNYGDCYAGGGNGGGGSFAQDGTRATKLSVDKNIAGRIGARGVGNGLKPKDLAGMPWRLALALQASGWFLRQDIIWHKPNPMPESVQDRCTKAHEYVFLLSKSPRYFFDQEALLEPVSPNTHARIAQNVQAQVGSTRANGGDKSNGNMKAVTRKAHAGSDTGVKNNPSFDAAMAIMPMERNKRSVWTIPTQSFRGAHFATFPEALVEPCVLAGSKTGQIVFDPFGGSGTVPQVAQRLGRNWISCELNTDYLPLHNDRTRQFGLTLETVA